MRILLITGFGYISIGAQNLISIKKKQEK